jgi:hypothetical protein
MHEGADAFDRFRKAPKKIVSVPKSALPPRPSRTKKKAAKLVEGTVMEREAQPVCHEPCRLLWNADGAGYLARANPV